VTNFLNGPIDHLTAFDDAIDYCSKWF